MTFGFLLRPKPEVSRAQAAPFVSAPSAAPRQLAAQVAEALGGDLSVLEDRPVTLSVQALEVVWDGVDLHALQGLFVEGCRVPWPQPIARAQASEQLETVQKRGMGERERRALMISAVRVVANRVPVFNAPALAADLARSPGLALLRLGALGLPTCPFGIHPEPTGRKGIWAFDCAGEFGLVAPAAGLRCEVQLDSPILEVLALVGDELAAKGRLQLSECGTKTEIFELGQDQAAEDQTALARSALRRLGLDFGLLYLSGLRVAAVEVNPDWKALDDGRGKLARAVADLLQRNPTLRPKPILAAGR